MNRQFREMQMLRQPAFGPIYERSLSFLSVRVEAASINSERLVITSHKSSICHFCQFKLRVF